MNSKQDSKLKMYRATEKHCDENTTLVATIPAFQIAFNNFKTKIADIISTAQKQDVILKGITVEKNNARQTLCQLAAEIAGIIYAYASAVSNQRLKEEVNFSYSALFRTRDDQLAPRCQNIHNNGTANLAALADYGINAQALTALQNAIDNYSVKAPNPRTATSQRKTLRTNLVMLFDEADTILREQMDKLVVNFKLTDPDFVKAYEFNRVIPSPPSTTTQLKGEVTNESDGEPIKGASITIVESSIIVKTNASGEYLIKPAPVGQFTIRIAAEGFNTFEAEEVEIKLGVVNDLDIDLVAL